jgi:hypothetical protein
MADWPVWLTVFADMAVSAIKKIRVWLLAQPDLMAALPELRDMLLLANGPEPAG